MAATEPLIVEAVHVTVAVVPGELADGLPGVLSEATFAVALPDPVVVK